MKQYFIEQNSVIAQWFTKNEGRQEWNQHIGVYEKWQTLIESQAEIPPVAEGTKWKCVDDQVNMCRWLSDLVNLKILSIIF